MNTKYQPRLERVLKNYSVDAETWWDGTGDTDQMLAAREFIESRFDVLDAEQIQTLRAADARVMRTVSGLVVADSSWDVAMLRKVAAIAASHTENA